jgi:leucyl/phenylalanyl-tRNA--protein transferase
MSELRWLSPTDGPESLPDPSQALGEPNGLLAAGGSLEPEWLLESYRRGIFPWFEGGQPILWWSPDPRTVLRPDEYRVSRSLAKRLRRGEYEVTADRAFDAVIRACAEPRRYTDSTWITPLMIDAYNRLHEIGWAHSFEAWRGDELAGGLYGISIGRVFFGESMFARHTDASKVAFSRAIEFLQTRAIELIDCQLPSAHLSSLGAGSMPRAEFLALLERATTPVGEPGSYREAFAAMFGREHENNH